MKRTTIALPDELAALVEYEAGRRGTSVSDVIRESIAATLLPAGKRKIPFAAICDDPELPAGSSMDEALAGWDDDLARRRR